MARIGRIGKGQGDLVLSSSPKICSCALRTARARGRARGGARVQWRALAQSRTAFSLSGFLAGALPSLLFDQKSFPEICQSLMAKCSFIFSGGAGAAFGRVSQRGSFRGFPSRLQPRIAPHAGAGRRGLPLLTGLHPGGEEPKPAITSYFITVNQVEPTH